MMSGTIALSPTVRWSAASWLFDWVLNSLAEAADDTELAAELAGVVGENIGWFGVNDLADEQAVAVLRILRAGLRTKAERGFPATMPGREAALQHLDELSHLASDKS
jgi:hypothetical protein